MQLQTFEYSQERMEERFQPYDVYDPEKIHFLTFPEECFQTAETLRGQLLLPAAIAAYHAAERTGFDADRCASARWICYMLAGEWHTAWNESDAIASRGADDPNRFWDGSDWAGKDIMLRCLHGLGDTLQFVRYAALLRERAQTVTIEAQPALRTLIQNSGLADRVITWGEPEPNWQVQMEVNELPRIFRTTPHSIPRTVPYLRAASILSRGSKILSERPKILSVRSKGFLRLGVVWAASAFDPARTVPPELLQSLCEIPFVEIFTLQAGAVWPAGNSAVTNLMEPGTTIDQVADHMAGLDLILTVDTMAAHLAGALGLPVWTLLRHGCDWRWMIDRTDTPWYPTMRLFRQPRSGDWPAVVADVRAALLALR